MLELSNIQANHITTDDQQWVSDLANDAKMMVWQDLQAQFAAQEQLEIDIGLKASDQQQKQLSGLYIFVSSSMPKPLLRSYFEQANIYGGTLVFKGLPNGSFQQLIQLVTELVGEQDEDLTIASCQIDDQAFARFNIEQVPTIILVAESEYAPNQSSKISYDKMTGNVGIKYAMEQFSQSGELHNKALEHLNAEYLNAKN